MSRLEILFEQLQIPSISEKVSALTELNQIISGEDEDWLTAEDDKGEIVVDKVLKFLWTFAHSTDVTETIMNHALSTHIKILEKVKSVRYGSCATLTGWLDKCVQDLKANANWVLPALNQIKEICNLYQETPIDGMHGQRAPAELYRSEVINRLQQSHALVILVVDSLTQYMAEIRTSGDLVSKFDSNEFFPDGRYSHTDQVSERLNFLTFLLRDGELWLCAPQANKVWCCLAEGAVFSSDRELCFMWFRDLISEEEPDLSPACISDFFESNLLNLDPAMLTGTGIQCFDMFFNAVNCKSGALGGSTEDPKQNVNVDWDVVVHETQQHVCTILNDKKKAYEELKEKEQVMENEILVKQRLIVANKLQNFKAEKINEAKMTHLHAREDNLKKKIDELMKQKKIFKDERKNQLDDYQQVATSANHEQQVLTKEIQSLLLKRDEIKAKLESFKEFSLTKHANRENLQRFIQDKMKDIECPVCLEEASAPIFSCMKMHIICSTCRNKVVRNCCPVCRGNYGQEKMRHRFAEKISEELGQMRKELEELDG